jgi:hypothetical protein
MKRFTPDTDGIDHINVYSKGKTSLGRFLTNMYEGKVITAHGEFPSIESYWHWLKLDLGTGGRIDQNLFKINAYQSKKLAQKYTESSEKILEHVKNNVQSDSFKSFIKIAIKMKIDMKDNAEMKKEFIESNLPFSHYYYYGDKNPKIHYLDQYQWLMDFLNDYRKELVENPNGNKTI